MPKRVDHEARRKEILAAAVRVLARDGTLNQGLVAVAEEAGMKRAAMYHYYRDRESLLDDVAATLLENEEGAFAAALTAEGGAAERITELARAVGARFDEWAELGGALLEIWSRNPERVRTLLRALRKVLVALVREGQARREITRETSAETLATLIIAVIDGVMLQVLIDPKGTPRGKRLERTLEDALTRLLVTTPHERRAPRA